MGRISEALRRAGQTPAQPTGVTPDQGRFVAPWAVEPDAPAQPEIAARVASASPAPAAAPAAPPSPPAAAPPFEAHQHQAGGRHVARATLLHRFRPDWKPRLSVGPDIDPLFAEQFRRLAASLIQSQRTDQLKSVLITSATPSEGKTLSALNLAMILSESYRRRVLLIDADLRKPMISEALNMAVADGLSEAIYGSDDRKVTLVQLTETLTLLPAGRPQGDPLSGLTSMRMNRLLDEARTRFDWVIVDSPPLGAAADAGLICPMVDAALIVIRAGLTPHAAIQRTIETLGKDRILGVVLNGADGQMIAGDVGYGYGYGHGYGPPEGSETR